jgi:alpha-D-xyloside xylohydrolase
VTTAESARTVRRTAGVFLGAPETTAPGRYAMMLDVGQEMAQRHHVEIDGTAVVDLANRWLPPTTSWFLELEPGTRASSDTRAQYTGHKLAIVLE